jgi:esterase/lipase superfamily enzyme
MERFITSWYSGHLHKEMPVAVYGHYGFALLMNPTAAADYLEYERFQLIDALSPFINGGMLKVFSINSINTESWMNDYMNPRDLLEHIPARVRILWFAVLRLVHCTA